MSYNKHLSILLSERQYQALKNTADRQETSMTAVARKAVMSYVLGSTAYFYVRLDDDVLIPPVTEPGFIDFGVAKAIAVERRGQVFIRDWQPCV